VRAVAVLGVGCCEVDVPPAVDGVELGRPDVARVGLVWGWAPDYLFLAVGFVVEEAVGGPEFNVAAACKGHVVGAFVEEDIGIRARAVSNGEDGVVVTHVDVVVGRLTLEELVWCFETTERRLVASF
jgi:hypothetical protein